MAPRFPRFFFLRGGRAMIADKYSDCAALLPFHRMRFMSFLADEKDVHDLRERHVSGDFSFCILSDQFSQRKNPPQLPRL